MRYVVHALTQRIAEEPLHGGRSGGGLLGVYDHFCQYGRESFVALFYTLMAVVRSCMKAFQCSSMKLRTFLHMLFTNIPV